MKPDMHKQFDVCKPYILHRSKARAYWCLGFSILLFVCELMTNESNMPCIILAVIIALVGINALTKKDEPLQIDQQGITAPKREIILWEHIDRCFYVSSPGKNPSYYLRIIFINDEITSIYLNDYSFDGKKFAAAIDFYSGRKLFGQTKQDQKEELKGLLILLAVIIVFFSLLFFIFPYLRNK